MANLLVFVPKVQAEVRAQGVIFLHVSHYVSCGSHFHPGVEIHATSNPTPAMQAGAPAAAAMAVDDGLFTLHHRVISDIFLERLHTVIH